MRSHLRVSCLHVPTHEGLHCELCGMRLDPPQAVTTAAAMATRPRSPGALWVEDLAIDAERPTEPMRLHPAAAQADAPPELPPFLLTLRDVRPPPPPPSLLPLPEARMPQVPAAATAVAPAAPAAAPVSPRIARRAAVRRARRAQSPATRHVIVDVLAFDPGASTSDTLHSLLSIFGFSVHAVGDADLARELMTTRRFAAVFVDVLLDAAEGDAGLDLCRHAKALAKTRGDETPALVVLVSAKLSPTQRVAAELAGFDAIVAAPVTRGSVAQVLDSHGIVLPADPRHN